MSKPIIGILSRVLGEYDQGYKLYRKMFCKYGLY